MRPPRLVISVVLGLVLGCNGSSAPASGEKPTAPKPTPAPAKKAAEAPAEPAPSADPGDAPGSTTQVTGADAVATSGGAASSDGGGTGSGSASETTAGGETGEQPSSTPDHSILILGSSLARIAFGSMLEESLDEHPQVDCHRFAKSATGLSRPDFFDWTAAATRELGKHDPDVVVVVMGGNDGQDLRVVGGKARVEWGSEGWGAAYRERVDDFVKLLAGEDRQVLWLGIPRTATTKLEAKLVTIREVHRAGVEAHPRGTYIDPTPFIEDEDGELRTTIEVGGKNRALRGDDGVHFTMAGCRYLADRVAPQILGALGVPEADGAPEAGSGGEGAAPEAEAGSGGEGAAPDAKTGSPGAAPDAKAGSGG